MLGSSTCHTLVCLFGHPWVIVRYDSGTCSHARVSPYLGSTTDQLALGIRAPRTPYLPQALPRLIQVSGPPRGGSELCSIGTHCTQLSTSFLSLHFGVQEPLGAPWGGFPLGLGGDRLE